MSTTSARITERSVLSFGGTNPVSVATKDLFAVCEQTGNVPIILLPPTHGQRPPPRISVAAKRLLSNESRQKQEEAFAKQQAQLSDKKAKKKNPITRPLQQPAPTENKQERMSKKRDFVCEGEFEEAVNDEDSDSGLPDEDEDDVKQYLADDDEDEEGDDGEDDDDGDESTTDATNDTDDVDDDDDDDDADVDDKIVKKQKASATKAVKKNAKGETPKAPTATSTRKKAPSAKATDPLREQNKGVLKKMKEIFNTPDFKLARTEDMRRIAFAVAHDVVVKDIANLKGVPPLYDEMVAFSKLSERVDGGFPWYGKLTKAQVADAIKRMRENANRVERTLDTIEPKIKKLREDLLADAVGVINLPDPIEASGDDVVRCEILLAPVHRRNTTNLQISRKGGRQSTMRVCTSLVDGVKSIVLMLSFPLPVKKLCEERYEKKTKKTRGKAANDTIVRGKSSLAEAIKKLVEDPSTSSVVTKATAFVTKAFNNLFGFIGRFETARKILIQDAAAVASAAASATSMGANNSVAGNGFHNSTNSATSDQDFVDVDDNDEEENGDVDEGDDAQGVHGADTNEDVNALLDGDDGEVNEGLDVGGADDEEQAL